MSNVKRWICFEDFSLMNILSNSNLWRWIFKIMGSTLNRLKFWMLELGTWKEWTYLASDLGTKIATDAQASFAIITLALLIQGTGMNPPPICAWRVCHSRRREGCVFRSGLVTRTGGRIVSMLVRFPPGFGRYKMCFALCLAQVRTHKDCLPRLSRLGIGLTLPFSSFTAWFLLLLT